MQAFLNRIPGGLWVGLIGLASSALTVYLTTQYPENAPAWVAAALVVCSGLVVLVKGLYPAPTVPLQDGPTLPAGAAATPRGADAAPMPARPGKWSRALFGG